MKHEYVKVIKKLLENFEGNLQLRTARGFSASHPYKIGGYARVYGKSDYDIDDAIENEVENEENFEKVEVSKAFHEDLYE